MITTSEHELCDCSGIFHDENLHHSLAKCPTPSAIPITCYTKFSMALHIRFLVKISRIYIFLLQQENLCK